MTKFRDLISSGVPVLIYFYKTTSNDLSGTLNDVIAILGNQVKVIKIDINKNLDLITALRINAENSYVIYKDEEMKWRQNGEISAIQLMKKIQEFS